MNKLRYNSFTIVHLYSKEMNIYGDLGNIRTLQVRMEQRGYRVEVINVGLGKLDEEDLPIGDLYFMGGGQDDDMYKVFDDLVQNKKKFIENEVKSGKVFLLICGAFQLFGRYFLDSDGRQMQGLGILPINTRAPSDLIKDRCVGNIISQLNLRTLQDMTGFGISYKSKYLVGFENHSGQTFFEDSDIKPLGDVVYGKGNNAVQKIEGARFNNIFGSYMHGSLLPKNPHFADLLLNLALQTRARLKKDQNPNGNDIGISDIEKINEIESQNHLKNLDDEVEWKAHHAILTRFLKD